VRNMDYIVELTEPAFQDIDQSFEFIALDAPTAARRWFDEVFAVMASLRTMPRRAQRIPEASPPGTEYRQLIHNTHRIIFRIEEASQKVVIVRVYHTSRASLKISDLM